jgi:dihydrofolate reductase
MATPGVRKLKLQAQMTVDGYVGGPNGELDWMSFNWDDKIQKYVIELTDSVDTILLGRKMTDGFITYWTNVLANPADPEYSFARKMVDKPKVVFTKKLDKSNWENTTIAKGDLAEEINKLKKKSSPSDGGQFKDIIVYGGASFVSSLVKNNLIDGYHFFINPGAIGKGLSIFSTLNNKLNLKLVKSIGFDCGIVLNNYEPRNQV